MGPGCFSSAGPAITSGSLLACDARRVLRRRLDGFLRPEPLDVLPADRHTDEVGRAHADVLGQLLELLALGLGHADVKHDVAFDRSHVHNV